MDAQKTPLQDVWPRKEPGIGALGQHLTMSGTPVPTACFTSLIGTAGSHGEGGENPSMFSAYLERYLQDVFASPAELRLIELGAGGSKP